MSYFFYDHSMRGLKLLTPPSAEPVSLDLAKKHLRVEADFTDDDEYIQMLITTARQWAETFTRRALCNQQWRLTLDRFPATSAGDDSPLFFWWRRGVIEIPKPIVISVDALSYVNVDGTIGSMTSGTDYKVDIQDAYCRIEPVWPSNSAPTATTFWPFTRFEIAALHIDFTSGYTGQAGDPDKKVPGPIKHAILLMLGALYENREDISATEMHAIPGGAKALLWPYRSLGWPS